MMTPNESHNISENSSDEHRSDDTQNVIDQHNANRPNKQHKQHEKRSSLGSALESDVNWQPLDGETSLKKELFSNAKQAPQS